MFSITIGAKDLSDLATVSAFASTDKDRPILTGVFIEYDGAGTIKATATDSYKLAIITRETDGAKCDAFSVLVDGKGFAAAVKNAYKDAGRAAWVKLVVNPERGRVEVGAGEFLYPAAILDGTYPATSNLIPSDDAYAAADGVNRIGLNPVFVGQFAKIAPWNGDKAAGVIFYVMDAHRPIKAVSQDGRTVALLMPIRIQ